MIPLTDYLYCRKAFRAGHARSRSSARPTAITNSAAALPRAEDPATLADDGLPNYPAAGNGGRGFFG